MSASDHSVDMARQITFRVDDDLEEQLDEYLDSDEHLFKPNQSEVMRTALEEFLEEHA